MFSLLLQPHHVPETSGGSLGDLVLSTDPSYGSIIDLAGVSARSPDNRLENAIAQDFTITENTLTFESEEENIAQVQIEGIIYTLGIGELEPGQFKYDDGKVTVKLSNAISSNAIVSIRLSLQRITHRTTGIPLPLDPVLARWNAVGSFNLRRSFKAPPTASFNFVDCLERETYIRTQLCNGTELLIENMRWVVKEITITRKKQSDQIVVQVSLIHYLASRGNPSKSPLDIPLKKKKVTGRDTYLRTYSLSQYAREVGVNIVGANIDVRSSRYDSEEETITVRQLINQRAITAHAFPFYGDTLELRNWYNTRVHLINEDDIIGDFTINVQGHGTTVDGVKLDTEYRNRKVKLDFDPDASDRNVGITQRWVFENCRDLEDLYSPREDRGFYFTQPDPDSLRNIGLNHDAGGRRKTGTKITSYNGTPTFEERYIGGYAFASSQTYEAILSEQNNTIIRLRSDNDPNLFWQEVEATTSNYIFDADGYKTQKITTGQKIARLQQETEQLEAVVNYAKALQNGQNDGGIIVPDPSFLAQSRAYEFSETLPINDVINYTLELHSTYFEDTVQPSDRCNSQFVEPKFVELMHRFSLSEIIRENPKNTENFTYPQIITGTNLFEFEQSTVTNSVFPFQFENHKSVSSNEGEYFKNAIALGSVTQNDGKPGIAPRLNRDLDLTNTTTRHNYERYRNSNYFLGSVGVTEGVERIQEGTLSYPDIDDPFELAAIARTDLSMINSQNSETATIKIHWRSQVQEGDFALIQGKLWKIFSINDQRKIQHQKYTSTAFELTLGRYLVSDLILEDRQEC